MKSALLACCWAELELLIPVLFATSSDSTLILSTSVRKCALSSGEKLWAKDFSNEKRLTLLIIIVIDVSNIAMMLFF